MSRHNDWWTVGVVDLLPWSEGLHDPVVLELPRLPMLDSDIYVETITEHTISPCIEQEVWQ